jgi:ferric-dicitrate binding protein FerR (iron transport regulator)
VTLEGEGFFDIVSDPSKPFKVHTGKVVTTVLGTSFNINTLESEKVTVTVTRGKVAVGDKDHTYTTILPNEQISVNTSNGEFEKLEVDSQQTTAWKDDYFIIDNVTFEEAASQIEKRFNVKITIVNESLKGCVVSAWFFNNESLKQIVDDLSTLKQATPTINGNRIVIRDGKGCKGSV